MQPSDETLVRACQQGDAAAWETLVTRYQRLIYTIPRRAGLDEQVASDVFQRVFAVLVQKLDTIEQPERIQAWLVTTAKRETWRVLRQQRAMVSLSDDEPTQGESVLPAHDPLPDEVVLLLEEQHLVRAALAQIDERCRSLLTLLFYRAEIPSYTDIAAQLGTSAGSIGPTRARCLQKLQRKLEKGGFE